MSDLLELVVELHGGDRWRARVNIPVLMERRTQQDLCDFVRLYCAKCSLADPENVVAIHAICEWFSRAIARAKTEWHSASQYYNSHYQTPLQGRGKAARERARINRELAAAVRKARVRVDKLEKRQQVFMEECQRRRIPV